MRRASWHPPIDRFSSSGRGSNRPSLTLASSTHWRSTGKHGWHEPFDPTTGRPWTSSQKRDSLRASMHHGSPAQTSTQKSSSRTTPMKWVQGHLPPHPGTNHHIDDVRNAEEDRIPRADLTTARPSETGHERGANHPFRTRPLRSFRSAWLTTQVARRFRGPSQSGRHLPESGHGRQPS